MNASEYKPMSVKGGRVLVKPSSLKVLKNVDAVVFDCDGVLIDTRGSYDATIIKVATTMISNIARVQLPYGGVGSELILRLRRTGGFNNDWDTTYALILFSVLSLPEKRAERVANGLSPKNDGATTLSKSEAESTLNRLRNLINEFCSSTEGVGYSAVNRFLERRKLTAILKSTIANSRRYLGYPGSPPQSLMATIFDEIYCGPELFKKTYGFPARYYKGRGMIEEEKLLVNREILERLKRVLGGKRIAMATGRPFIAAKYSLHHLMSYFDRRASIYIGDADVNPKLAPEYEKYRKPRGESLIRAREEFATDGMLYVGDSTEDYMMVEDARTKYEGILFAGISGTASNEEERTRYFTERGADLVVRSVEQVPLVLEAFRS